MAAAVRVAAEVQISETHKAAAHGAHCSTLDCLVDVLNAGAFVVNVSLGVALHLVDDACHVDSSRQFSSVLVLEAAHQRLCGKDADQETQVCRIAREHEY